MTELERQIEGLTAQLHELRGLQIQMNHQLVLAERELENLKALLNQQEESTSGQSKFIISEPVKEAPPMPYVVQAKLNNDQKRIDQQKKPFYVNREMEDFIGTNVISKIGILVTIIGVFIGAKYAIDNELISPFVRILAGYLAAGVLIFIAFRLKAKYAYFSSILVGGGLSVTYFITYIAYSFYGLFALWAAFIIMVFVTAVSVVIALWYNQKVIALLGQVAAYAIPFLLSNGQGNIFVLYSYITLINFGLLLLSFKKDWKLLYHIAFFLTWLIYFSSMLFIEKMTGNFAAALFFLTVNFVTFYITFLAYKVFKKELYQVGEIGILLFNALFFFFLGTTLINQQFNNVHFLTWFTIANACIHFATGYLIYRLRLVDESVFQFIVGLGLLFVTVAVPIELDGNWVTVLWTVEAAALVYVARSTKRQLYLKISLPLIAISLISLAQDWGQQYDYLRDQPVSRVNMYTTPFANINFTLSLFVCACLGFIGFATNKFDTISTPFVKSFFCKVLPIAFLVVFYLTLFNEIHFSWDEIIGLYHTKAAIFYQSITLVIYSCMYVSMWLFINNTYIKNVALHHLLIVLALFVDTAFLSKGLIAIGDLRQLYIDKTAGASYLLLMIRYFSFAALAIMWLSAWKGLHVFKPSSVLQRRVSTVFSITLLTIISNEFIHWMDLSGYQNQYKLGLSLICGGYALGLLFAGMVKNKKHLRIAAIVLFGGTLVKLFFYDLASLSTISKTIVLVLLGTLLLLASFLYNKYKDLLFSNEETSV
ncbi:MAG: DUF2339 domain-containing protein [Bacteroidota bacterium]|nr:DUF2339 domain-containing protein [Bacteroidota bacterium]